MTEHVENTPAPENTPAKKKDRTVLWIVVGIGCLVAIPLMLVVASVLVATVLAIGPDGIEQLFTDILDAIAGER